jgi:hypothetical protein
MLSDLALDFFEMNLGFASYFLARLERFPRRFLSAAAPLTASKLHPTTPLGQEMHDRRKLVDAFTNTSVGFLLSAGLSHHSQGGQVIARV